MISQFFFLMPEILLAAITVTMQVLVSVFKNQAKTIVRTGIFSLLILTLYIISLKYQAISFNNSFAVSPFILIFKGLVLSLALMSCNIYIEYVKITKAEFKLEFITLILLSTLGIFISISAQDFLLLFCGLEMQALSGYALAAFNVNQVKSSEAGLKYFILGALMSVVMLLGISYMYGYSGSIKFAEIRLILNEYPHIGLITGAVFMLSAILFKLSVAPLHVWTPDVYEGAPITAVSFFAVASKIGMLIVLIGLIDNVIGDIYIISVTLIKIAAVLSMIIGSLGALMQNSIKRLLAYSSVLNIGYVLIGISLGSQTGKYAAFIYMLIYSITSIGFFAALINILGEKSEYGNISDLKGIGYKHKKLSIVLMVFIFSFIGLPPFAGFFGKYYLFLSAAQEGELDLAIIGLLSSVIAAVYYLKIIKYMYFETSLSKFKYIPVQRGLLSIMTISSIFVVFFIAFASNYIFTSVI